MKGKGLRRGVFFESLISTTPLKPLQKLLQTLSIGLIVW